MALTKEQRDGLPAEHFAVPGKRKLPINDETHTRLAWDIVDRTGGLTEEERSSARSHILRRAKELGLDTSEWEKSLKHAADVVTITLRAMSLALPHVENHPNRMPFAGVLTRVDEPSDMPPSGSLGKRTYLSRDVAAAMLPSLLGMPIDFTPELDGHDAKRKIGTIMSANIVGNAIEIGGFFYAADFPDECDRIQAEKEDLGFSYEIRAQTRVTHGDLLEIVGGSFTGAAVLRKDKAAYQTTSLAANAAKELTMTKEEFEALFASALGPIATGLKTLTDDVTTLKASGAHLEANAAMRAKVAPHATAIRNCAAAMEGAGMGMHPQRGHVAALNRMAASMENDANMGKLPHIFRDHDWEMNAGADDRQAQPKIEDQPAFKAIADQISTLGTKLEDIKAAAFKAVQPPERKTISASSTALLAKGGIKEVPKEGLTESQVDAALQAAGVPLGQKTMAAKMQLANEGLLLRN